MFNSARKEPLQPLPLPVRTQVGEELLGYWR